MYQLEKDEGSEFCAAIVHTGPSLSKTSLTVQQLVKKQKVLFHKNFKNFILFFCISMINKLVSVVHNH